MSRSGEQKYPSVVIVERSQMSSELMATALRRSRYRVEVVGCTTDRAGIRSILHKKKPTIALIGTLKDGPDACFEMIREVRASHPGVSNIMMLDSTDRALVVEAFRAGAVGILSQDEPFNVLCKCIHSVHRGQVWAGSQLLRYALDALAQAPPASKTARGMMKTSATVLTKREEDIVKSVADGLTNRDISRRLNLSEHTVRNYLFRIFNKVGTSTRLELALYALHSRSGSHPGRNSIG